MDSSDEEFFLLDSVWPKILVFNPSLACTGAMGPKGKKAKRKQMTISSSDSEDDKDDAENENNADGKVNVKDICSKQRLRRKKPKFVLPTRSSVWDEIPSLKGSLEFSLKSLSPKKAVNNFTKVYNSYNRDDYEDEDTTYSEASGSEEEKVTPTKKAVSHRIKNRLSRVARQSSSSDDGVTDRCRGEPAAGQSSGDPIDGSIAGTIVSETPDDLGNICEETLETQSDEDFVCSHRRNQSYSLLESDEEETIGDHTVEKSESVEKCKSKFAIKEDTKSINLSTKGSSSKQTGTDVPSKGEDQVILTSSGDSGSDESDSDSSEGPRESRAARLSAKKQRTEKAKFHELRLAQQKRKKSLTFTSK